MSHDVQMDYGQMEQMAVTFLNGAEQFQATLATVQQIISMLEGGALLGNAGDKFAEVLNTKLVGKLKSGEQKMLDLANEINGAMNDMQSADSTAASQMA